MSISNGLHGASHNQKETIMEKQKKEIRIASAVLQIIAMVGLVTGIYTNTAMPVIAGAVASATACLWQFTVCKWGE